MVSSFRWTLPLLVLAVQLLPMPATAAELTDKEAFMLMFGKGNGAMRVLCALERDGLITPAIRRRYIERLEQLLSEPADSATDRRNARIGMAFADGRASLCPERLLPRSGS